MRKTLPPLEPMGKSPAQAVLDSGAVDAINRMADDMEAAIGNDVSAMLGNALHETASPNTGLLRARPQDYREAPDVEIQGAANPQHVADFFGDRRREKFLDQFYGALPRPSEPEITLDAYLGSTLSIRALLVAYTDPRKVGFWL